MTRLSIIIVSYNVKYYLEQCLWSVLRATTRLQTEIWVVDNASTDGRWIICNHVFLRFILLQIRTTKVFQLPTIRLFTYLQASMCSCSIPILLWARMFSRDVWIFLIIIPKQVPQVYAC